MSSKGGADSGIKQAYTELVKADRAGDFERALKASNRILRAKPADALAFRCRVVCLVKLQKFEETLLLIRKTAPSLTKGTEVEKAYCEYRLNRNDEAFATIEALEASSGGGNDSRWQELKAQLLYRLERYAECRDIYRRLIKNSTDDGYEVERRANLLAVQSQIQQEQVSVTEVDSYEEHYNLACCLIRREKYKEALKYLRRSEEMCREFLQEDDTPEEEIEEELAPIRTQTAYCKQMLGQHDDAQTIYAQILKNRPSDAVVVAVSSNNSCCGRKEFHVFDVRKKLKTCHAAELKHKLTSTQKKIACFNNAVLLLLTNQLEPCRKTINEIRSYTGMEEEAVVLEAALLGRQKEADKGIELLSDFASHHPSDNIMFSLAQLALGEGKFKEAKVALEKLDKRWNPGPLSLLVALNLESDHPRIALKLLSDACERIKTKSPSNSEVTAKLLEECATMNARIGDAKLASQCLEELRKLKKNDPHVLAQLIQIYSRFDQEKAQQVSVELLQLDTAQSTTNKDDGAKEQLDVDALESSAEWILFGERYRQKKEAKQAAAATEDEQIVKQKGRKKRKRKPKLPKVYDPSVAIDPERWLPKQERSYYKKRKDKRHKDRDVGRGTQGAATAAASDQLDASKATGTVGAGDSHASPKPTPTATVGPRQQRPGGQQAKKKPKKKGGKW